MRRESGPAAAGSRSGLDDGAARLAARTLWAGLVELFGGDPDVDRLRSQADEHSSKPSHALAPAPTARTVTTFTVGEEDTAAAMGHPDGAMAVLGSPRLGLWFEVATSPLMPPPESGARHVGVGLVVHHLGSAVVGEEVAVEARVQAVDGRAVVFALSATTAGRIVATGVHHRRILDQHPAAG